MALRGQAGPGAARGGLPLWAADLLHYWFHTLRPADWFAINPAVDAELRRRFRRDLDALRGRPVGAFVTSPDLARAAILLFDQVPRNLYRGDPRAFAQDTLARAITMTMLRRGWHHGLSRAEKQFAYMPLMHSEHIADQRLSLILFARLRSSYLLGFARSHYRMIARFGRFPHRNAVLGRGSTPAETRAVEAGHAW